MNIPQQDNKPSIPVDLIRTIAIVAVILLHAAEDLTTVTTMDTSQIFRWTAVDIYQCVGRMGVPLFVMLTGALLLMPSKTYEDLGTFFKKRFSRIGLPFLFWAVIYFAFDIFILNELATAQSPALYIAQGILTGPYDQFWYIYMLVGLYLITPFLRLMVAHANNQLFKYFAVLWFIGTALVPFVYLLTPLKVDANLFTIPAFVGYFVMGYYLLRVKVNRRFLTGLMVASLAATGIGTYFTSMIYGGPTSWFFQEYVSPTMILASIAFFTLLISSKSATETQQPQSLKQKLLHLISENTLSIYFLHLIVLYVLHIGVGGYALNGNTVNSIIGVPLATALTLVISLAIIVPLKKVPYLKKFIG